MSAPPTQLYAATELRPDPSVAHRYHWDVPPTWNIAFAFGGLTMTACLRASQAELCDPSFVPLSSTTTFVSPVGAGPVRIDVTTLRAGKGCQEKNRG